MATKPGATELKGDNESNLQLASGDGIVALVNHQNTLTVVGNNLASAEGIVDAVEYGNAKKFEGSGPATNGLLPKQSIHRSDGNDTDKLISTKVLRTRCLRVVTHARTLANLSRTSRRVQRRKPKPDDPAAPTTW